MAAPTLAGSWVICSPLAPPSGVTNSYAGGWISRGGVLAVAVSHIACVTDNVSHYDDNGDPVFGAGVNIHIEGVGWVTIDGTRSQIAQLLGVSGNG
ncbi:hypothetical protein MMAR_3881 [Mycobacterium marinum M]|uniref:Uncharacterized protein n=2 Tax=Mycobacterium marinum TaxID=1781 RepID=B2HNP0_MYCMM|nr:hypothetical protein [Mycobacterium marinum]ACC42293.1 hypothetical protein MMAR_3881 [Mycobacterium marinum M]RFZ41413.1 hypothetical protein DAVIS_02682 [Mycobacterium marinum]